jgi:hypothetical protein
MRPVSQEVYGIPRERVIGSATSKPFLKILVVHDDCEREFDYTSGAEQALEPADTSGWTVASIKNDCATVF